MFVINFKFEADLFNNRGFRAKVKKERKRCSKVMKRAIHSCKYKVLTVTGYDGWEGTVLEPETFRPTLFFKGEVL